MPLTQDEKDDVYVTVSIELVKMFDILANLYIRPDQTDKAQLIADIETSVRAKWEYFKMPS